MAERRPISQLQLRKVHPRSSELWGMGGIIQFAVDLLNIDLLILSELPLIYKLSDMKQDFNLLPLWEVRFILKRGWLILLHLKSVIHSIFGENETFAKLG